MFTPSIHRRLCILTVHPWITLCLNRPPIGDFGRPYDQNQEAPLKDPLYVPIGHITRLRSKKIKEALNGLILT